MHKSGLSYLKNVISSGKSLSNKLWAAKIIVTYYDLSQLSIDDLFSLLPFMFENYEYGKYGSIIHFKVYQEMVRRQDQETLQKLIGLLESSDDNYRYIACYILCEYQRQEIIQPLVKIINSETNDFPIKLAAICALTRIEDEEVTPVLKELHKTYKNQEQTSQIKNYLIRLEWRLGIEYKP